MPEEKTDERGASEQAGEEAFETAFTEAAGVGDRPDLHKADDPANEKPDETPVAEKLEEKPATKPEEKPAEKAEAKPAEKLPEQQPGETDEKFEQRYKTLQGIHKHDRETWEAEKAKLLSDLETATKSPEKKEPTKEEKKAADAFVDSLTDEQKEELKVYEQDFDVVSKMEGIKRSIELNKLEKKLSGMFDQWKADIESKVTAYDSRIAPVEKLAEDTEREAHFNLIRSGYTREDGTAVPGHEDFEKYRDDGSLLKWIESKPKYLQPALKDTYGKGMATDVIDLFTDFKRDNNITEPESPSAKVVNIKRAEKKQALSSVDSRRGAINTGYQVAQDYDGAFDEALKK